MRFKFKTASRRVINVAITDKNNCWWCLFTAAISHVCWWCIEHVAPLRIHSTVDLLSSSFAVDDDVLILCTIRSWTDRERMTQTSSPPPTPGFARPSRRTRRVTPLCSPEHSRTKPSTCTGSRRNARKAARARQSPARLSSRSRAARKTPSEARGERDGGEEEIKAPNPCCSSVSSLHWAQLWSCPLFF